MGLWTLGVYGDDVMDKSLHGGKEVEILPSLLCRVKHFNVTPNLLNYNHFTNLITICHPLDI